MAKEKRLIDANALIQRFDGFGWGSECDGEIVLEAVANAPTVDAAEVVHGKWLFKHNPITDPKGYFIRIVCSECNLHTGQKSNYCPQCGAKMEGERREGE